MLLGLGKSCGCCGPLCCFLTSFPSLRSSTAPQFTLPLLPSSSSWLLCSILCTLVQLQRLFTSVVSTAVSWSHRSTISFVTKDWIFFLCFPRTSSAVESSASLILFARVSASLSKTQTAEIVPPTLAWNTSAVSGPRVLQVKSGARALYEAIRFNLMVLSTRSWPLPKSALDWTQNSN